MRTIHVRQVAVWVIAAFASAMLGCAAEPDADVDLDESAEATRSAVQSRPSSKVLNFSYEVQQTGYWCGPTATRAVISARMTPPTQKTLAKDLGTTTAGTNHIGLVTNVLNKYIGGYETRQMPNDPPTAAQKSALWADVVRSIDGGYGVVANIVAPASNHPPGYPNSTIFHYIAVVGYNADTSEVFIADSANFSGNKTYWLSFNQLSTLIPPKGYSAWFPKGTTCANGKGTVLGAIEQKYLQLGGCSSFLGAPISEEQATPDKVGRYTVFQNGSIYWTQATGAHEVHGVIRDAYKQLGWETSILRYPTTDEGPTSDGKGRKAEFQGGGIYWSQTTGAHEIYGDIRKKWVALGQETSVLGLPTSGEYGVSGGRKNDFQHGSITWTASTRAVSVSMNP